ncbi:MAG: hypothetical protein IT320_18650 [Anaerolineae bacterium]|nr:hypothetical protein [Anaerolineae bacterium]
MGSRRSTNITGMVEYKPGNRRQVTNAAGMFEYKPGKRRQVATLATMLEVEWGAPAHNGPYSGEGDACYAYAAFDSFSSGDPVSLLLGEKREQITDLSVMTPVGALAFTRAYRQSKLNDPDFQLLGMGWTHNHRNALSVAGSKLVLRTPGGGAVEFTQTATNHYDADPGSTAFIDYNVGSQRYTLTLSSRQTEVYDNTGQLLFRRWPNGDEWAYVFDNGQLVEINADDGRKLVFRYYMSGPHTGQLFRVGDHTFDDTDPQDLEGRYVEYAYSLNKVLDGETIVDGTDSLLTHVRDVRGYTWEYRYYVETGPQADPEQLNYLIEHVSPPVNGAGSEISLKSLSYQLQDGQVTEVVQALGADLKTTTYNFQPEADVSTETTAGKTTTHRFTHGVHQGSEDPAGNYAEQRLNWEYRPSAHIDANGSVTRLSWSEDGKLLNSVTDAKQNATQFAYNTNETLQASIDAEGRRTEYTYGDVTNNPRLPTRIKIIDDDTSHTVLRWQEFTYDDKGRTLTEKLIDPLDGTTVLQEVARSYYSSGEGAGLLQTVTQSDIGGTNDVTTTYSYDGVGRVVKTQQSSNFGACDISYTVYDEAGNVVASICNYDPGLNQDPEDAAQAVALYDEQTPDVNRVTTHEYDALGRRVKTTTNAGASFAQATLTFYDALNRVERTIGNYVNQSGGSPEQPDLWVWNPDPENDEPPRWEKSESDPTPIAHGTDNTENIISDSEYNARGMLRLQRDTLGNVTLYGYDDAGRVIKTIQSAHAPSYNNDYSGTTPDPTLGAYAVNTAPDQDLVSMTRYDAVGNVVSTQTLVDKIGSTEIYNVSFTVYDQLNRPIKTVRNAKDAATIDLDPGDMGYDAANDPRSSNYEPSTDSDRDQIETTEYDALGRVIRTQRLVEKTSSTEVWQTTLYGYDPLGRQVRVIQNPHEPDYNIIGDPSLAGYSISGNADQDILTLTAYDTHGRVMYTEDSLGRRTWMKYDGLNRAVKTIANAVGTATDGSVNDPRSDSYVPSTDSDKDRITITEYDGTGRVWWVQDPNGRTTWKVYDTQGRLTKTVVNCTYETGDPAPAPEDPSYVGSSNPDDDIISQTVYDAQGRVESTIDPLGRETRYEYDALGRRIKAIVNYVDGVFNAAFPDEDLISTTVYDRAGRVTSTTDARGTETAITYDKLGRRLAVTQVANTPQATSSYTNYDKAGRVRRAITHYVPLYPPVGNPTGAPVYKVNGEPISPDERDSEGVWRFVPPHHRHYNDTNLITEYDYDRAGRQISLTDPMGNGSQTTYFKDGSVDGMTDPEGVVIKYRYDGVRRRRRVVQGYIAQATSDPATWVWDATDGRWEQSNGTAILHGTDNDQNIIVDVVFDKAGRITSQHEPRGNETTYAYDQLNRRTALTNPLGKVWASEYTDVTGGRTRTTMTMPGITDLTNYEVEREFDRAGRLASITYVPYGDPVVPSNTPDVVFTYDKLGTRQQMSEYIDSTLIRETTFGYDDVRRLTSVGFDNDGGSSVDETVSYEYDAGGLRTKLILPGGLGLDVTYTYDQRGRLVSLTDWNSSTQETQFGYDNVGRHIVTERHNGLRSRYTYDVGGRLRRLRHTQGSKTLADFRYEVDKRGNRTQAQELLAHPATTTDTIIDYIDKGLVLTDDWMNYYNGFKVADRPCARLMLGFFGNEATLTMGTGPDHSIYDLYIDGSFWQSFDGYAASEGQRDILITMGVDSRKLAHEGPHVLEIRNRAEQNGGAQPSHPVVRFKQLVVADTTYTLHTIRYHYDSLARLTEARYAPGINAGAGDADLLRRYQYSYDLAGNRVQQIETVAGTPTTTNYTFNAANQMTTAGGATLTYDDNGNLTSDGTNTYAWDRANRLLSMGGVSYAYDGLNNRVSQTISSTVTQYLLDLQPGLSVVLTATTGANTDRYVHGPRGIHAQRDTADNWEWMVQDGLGSVRGVADNTGAVQWSGSYADYGTPYDEVGTPQTMYGFTGEPTNETGLVHLRARDYNPALGIFTALDLFEGMACTPMTLNGYSWVAGNTPNATDASGRCYQATDCSCHVWPFNLLCQSGSPIFRPCNARTPTPVPTLAPCGMRDKNGVNVLAATAITESDGFGPLAQNDVAIAGLMVMQLNTFIATGGINWRELGTWTSAGQSTTMIVADPSQTRILNIATQIVNGYCANPSDPMALVNQSYPDIAGNRCLQGIAGNPDARSEVSIDATRAAEFRADPNYPLQCVFEASGADRAIVVGGAEITRAWLGYQCAVGEQAVLARDPNTIINALSATGNYTCTPCTTVAEWWWHIPSSLSTEVRNQIGTQVGQQISATQQFVRVNRSQGNNLNDQYGGGLYVASCS